MASAPLLAALLLALALATARAVPNPPRWQPKASDGLRFNVSNEEMTGTLRGDRDAGGAGRRCLGGQE